MALVVGLSVLAVLVCSYLAYRLGWNRGFDAGYSAGRTHIINKVVASWRSKRQAERHEETV